MERLRLPGPANRLWREYKDILNETLNGICQDKEPWILGGGTVLAARWFHRQSNDVDIFMPRSVPFRQLRESVDPRFARAMKARGAQSIIEGTSSIKIWMNDATRIEISHLDSLPAQTPHWMDVDGYKVCVASNAQIMTGKIKGRSHHSPIKDIFDAAVASVVDPEALAIAINSLDENGRRTLSAKLAQGERHYRNMAPQEIKAPSEEFKWALSNGPEKYIRALTELPIKAIAVELTQGKPTLVTVLGDGHYTETPIKEGRFISALEGQGPRDWVNEVGDDESIRRTLAKAHSERTAQWETQWAASQQIPGYTLAADAIGTTVTRVKATTKGLDTEQRQQAWRKTLDEVLGPTRIILAGDREIIEYAINRRRAANRRDDGHS